MTDSEHISLANKLFSGRIKDISFIDEINFTHTQFKIFSYIKLPKGVALYKLREGYIIPSYADIEGYESSKYFSEALGSFLSKHIYNKILVDVKSTLNKNPVCLQVGTELDDTVYQKLNSIRIITSVIPIELTLTCPNDRVYLFVFIYSGRAYAISAANMSKILQESVNIDGESAEVFTPDNELRLKDLIAARKVLFRYKTLAKENPISLPSIDDKRFDDILSNFT